MTAAAGLRMSLTRGVFVALASMSVAFACAPIKGSPLSEAPLNAGCPAANPCEAYNVPGMTTAAKCSGRDGRCDFGAPNFPFTMVIDLPTSSFYAPGRTFRLSSADLNPPPGTVRGTCIPPTCLLLPAFIRTQGHYRVTEAAATAVGLPLEHLTRLPARVTFVPLLPNTEDELHALGIPLPDVLTSSRLIGRPPTVSYADALSLGDFLRIAYPEPPYDEYFPPAFSRIQLTDRFVPDGFLDDFVLGGPDTELDDETGASRTATVTRAEGLDGFRAWLADGLTGRRISSIRTLSGTKASVRLDTTGQGKAPAASLDEDVDVIVAPPEGWLGVPRLQSRLVGGAGLDLIELPSLPAPVPISGVVADEGGDAAAGGGAGGAGRALTGIPARLLFTSTGLRLADGTLQPLLRYETTVSTNATGQFKTVLPPGTYDVTIEPDELTGYAKVKDTSFDTAKEHLVPVRTRRTVATGQVLLADGRPLADAEVFALPSERPAVGTAVKPRPARARTDREGRFRFEADQGEYNLVVDPQAGTGFPRFVQLRSIPTETAEIGIIEIAPPARLSFTLRDPSRNAIVRAMVRVFANLPNRGPPAVEIGRAMTDAAGAVEILLAQQPR